MTDYFKALLNLTKLTPNALREFAERIYAGMYGNRGFTKPAISMADLRGQIDRFSGSYGWQQESDCRTRQPGESSYLNAEPTRAPMSNASLKRTKRRSFPADSRRLKRSAIELHHYRSRSGILSSATTAEN
jgi:hypothetical protein